MNAIIIIEDAYTEYRSGWGIQGSERGACLAIVGELVAHGLAVDDAIGEASLEARVERVLDGYIAGRDGRVNSEEFACEVAVELGLISADEALAYTA